MDSKSTAARTEALSTILSQIDKRHGKGTVMRLGERTQADVEVISSGSRLLNEALGIGGYARGRVIEVFGPESSGKTTLALHAIAEVQRRGGTAAFIDAEHALDVAYARGLGVNVDQLLVSQPDSGEQALDVAEGLVRSGAVDLVVVDSVAALVPQAEIEGDMGDQHVGLQARLMSHALRKITAITSRTGTVVLFLNQLRQKIGVVFGNGEVTPGGNALKFYASVRLDIRRIGAVKRGEDNLGNRVKIKVVKNKLAPPFRTIETDLYFGRGFCPAAELLEVAERAGVLTRSGAWYSVGDERIANGRDASRERLLSDPELFRRIDALVLPLAVPTTLDAAEAK
jgi:recombination protein RecA